MSTWPPSASTTRLTLTRRGAFVKCPSPAGSTPRTALYASSNSNGGIRLRQAHESIGVAALRTRRREFPDIIDGAERALTERGARCCAPRCTAERGAGQSLIARVASRPHRGGTTLPRRVTPHRSQRIVRPQ